MRVRTISGVLAWCGLLGLVAVALGAVSNGSFTATWTAATDPAEQYEFRWRHFAAPEWVALPSMAGAAGSMRIEFETLPNTPTTDRWMCVDARMVRPKVGAWLSETSTGAACNTVDVAVLPVPTPPAPVPPPPSPPTETFSNLTNRKGVLSFDYQLADCKRGVQQTVGQIKNGTRTITLTCRR